MQDNIKFFVEDGKHGWKRVNAEGGTEHASALFNTLEEAQADAGTDINGEHTPEEVTATPEVEVLDSEVTASDEVPPAPEAEVAVDAPVDEPAVEEVA